MKDNRINSVYRTYFDCWIVRWLDGMYDAHNLKKMSVCFCIMENRLLLKYICSLIRIRVQQIARMLSIK